MTYPVPVSLDSFPSSGDDRIRQATRQVPAGLESGRLRGLRTLEAGLDRARAGRAPWRPVPVAR